jgi:hypothetical protein
MRRPTMRTDGKFEIRSTKFEIHPPEAGKSSKFK